MVDNLLVMEHNDTPVKKSTVKEIDDTSPGKPFYLPGELINGRYEVIKLLGKGSVGTVYQVKDKKVGTQAAVKLISEEIRRETTAASRLHHEIRIAYSIKSDYITNLYSLFTDDHHIGLVLEYVDGQSLYSYLQAKTVFGISDIMNIGRQVSLGLKAIHDAEIIHRDLKLENILLDNSGMAKITDFGVSILQSALIEEGDPINVDSYQLKKRATEVGKVVGTLHYLSPEYLTKRRFDVRTDIYAFGVVLYELTTCTFPYRFSSPRQLVEKKIKEDPPPPSQLRADCPKWLDDIILKAMARDPEERFQSAEEIYKEISPRLRTTQVSPRPQCPLKVRLRRVDLAHSSGTTESFPLTIYDKLEDYVLGLFDSFRTLRRSLVPESSFRTIVLTVAIVTLLTISFSKRYQHNIQNRIAVSEHTKPSVTLKIEDINQLGSGRKRPQKTKGSQRN